MTSILNRCISVVPLVCVEGRVRRKRPKVVPDHPEVTVTRLVTATAVAVDCWARGRRGLVVGLNPTSSEQAMGFVVYVLKATPPDVPTTLSANPSSHSRCRLEL